LHLEPKHVAVNKTDKTYVVCG